MIRWVTGFFDVPAAHFDAAVAFWKSITGCDLSDPRGETGEFATLVPTTGDSYLRVQRTSVRDTRMHLDFHVEHVDAHATRAIELGATELHRDDHVVLRSPAGFVFCFVGYSGESVVPPAHAIGDGPPQRLNQILIDIPHARFEDEVAFWSELTGWPTELHEGWDQYLIFTPPNTLPVRVGLQRLGPDDPAPHATAHPDIGCGKAAAEAVAAHLQIGGIEVGPDVNWVVMTDPAGLPYCLDFSTP